MNRALLNPSPVPRQITSESFLLRRSIAPQKPKWQVVLLKVGRLGFANQKVPLQIHGYTIQLRSYACMFVLHAYIQNCLSYVIILHIPNIQCTTTPFIFVVVLHPLNVFLRNEDLPPAMCCPFGGSLLGARFK